MLALQLLPSNSIAGIVIFTDGCSDIYSLETSMMMREGHVRVMGNMLRGESNICDILNRLRNQTISCSFVQVTENTPMNAFGVLPNELLMKFLSACNNNNRFEIHNEICNILTISHCKFQIIAKWSKIFVEYFLKLKFF